MESTSAAIDKDICSYCKDLPKIELHAHLNGSLSSQTLRALGCTESSMAKYQELNYILEKTERTLDECFKLFKVAHELTKTKQAVYFATESVIKDFENENVFYLELRTTPREEDNMTKEEYIESVVKAILDSKTGITVKLICSIDRRHIMESSEKSLELIIKMKNKYPNIIVGVDLSGNPLDGSFSEKLFEKARRSDLYVTLHCGEVRNDAEIEKMLRFQPDRLGHCTYLHPAFGGSKSNWELHQRAPKPIECCMTSNVLCGTAKSYQNHIIKELMNEDLPFCVCTDDKGVFCTSLSKEYHHAHETFELTEDKLFSISLNSTDCAFAPYQEKEMMRRHLKTWFKKRKR